MLVLAVPGAVLSVLWVVAGRALFGAGGSLIPVFAVSIGPALLAVLLLAARWMWRDALRYVGSPATTFTLGAVQLTCWVLAFIFGFLIPDRVNDRSVSAASQVFGSDLVGLFAGFGNTAGILTFVAAFAVLLLAWSENRRSARLAAGITDDDAEALAREQSEYEFLD